MRDQEARFESERGRAPGAGNARCSSTDPEPAHGGDVYAAARRWGRPVEELLDFSANLNPAGPPAEVIEALSAALGRIRHYPEPHAGSLAAALAGQEGVPEGALLVGAGATELIRLAALLAPGAVALTVTPTFGEYRRAVRLAGGRLAEEPLPPGQGFRPDPAALARALGRTGARLVFACNPNNPTGAGMPAEEVLWVADRAERLGALLVVDEAFVDLTDCPEDLSVQQAAWRRPGLVVIRSLTKFYALPGLRLGYAVARPDLAGRLRRLQDPWSVGVLAQEAGHALLAAHGYRRATRAWIRAQRPALYRALGALPGLRPLPPAANFILVDGSRTGLAAWELQERLGPMGILIRDCRSFGLPAGYFRVAVRSEAENRRLVAALGAILGGPRPPGPAGRGPADQGRLSQATPS